MAEMCVRHCNAMMKTDLIPIMHSAHQSQTPCSCLMTGLAEKYYFVNTADVPLKHAINHSIPVKSPPQIPGPLHQLLVLVLLHLQLSLPFYADHVHLLSSPQTLHVPKWRRSRRMSPPIFLRWLVLNPNQGRCMRGIGLDSVGIRGLANSQDGRIALSRRRSVRRL